MEPPETQRAPSQSQTQPQGQPLRKLPASVQMARTSLIPVELRKVLSIAIQSGKFPLYIHGTQGTGKSCLMGLVYVSWPSRAAWFSSSRLTLDLARCRMNPEYQCQWTSKDGLAEPQNEWQIWREINEADLLCLDDVASRDLTDTQADIMREILDRRIGKATICTSNLNETELCSAIDARTASRFVAGTIITIKGKDKRQEGATVFEVQL